MRTIQSAYVFTVEGTGAFPFDMLRYDQCWPRYERDAALLAHHRIEKRRIVLESTSASLPTSNRWESFGWRILGLGVIREEAA